MSAGAWRRATLAGIGGGLAAGVASVLPPLLSPATDARVGNVAGLLVALVAVELGTRAAAAARPGAATAVRLGEAALVTTLVSAGAGLALYVLYAWLRPGLLAEHYARYEARLKLAGLGTERAAAALAELASRRPEYLDPLFQAAEGAALVFFCGMLLGGYGAFRARLAARLAGSRGRA